jgi:hypothetical protein
VKCRLKFIISSLNLAMLISLLIPAKVLGQADSSAIQFHGSNALTGQYSNRQDTNSPAPKDFLRDDFQMTLTVHDVPLATSFFVTTEQSDNMQRINNLRFYVDLITLKKNRARIEAANKANNLTNTKAPWILRFLSNFSKIEVGRIRPDYGELTLQGIPVSGVNIEFTHKIVYAAFTSGQVKRATVADSNMNDTYKQKLIFGKLGLGAKETTHFYVTYMNISDETTVPLYSVEDTATTLKPQSNAVVGAEFRLSFLKNRWTIDGEAGLCAITRDTRVTQSYNPVYLDTAFKYIPYWLLDQVDANVSTSADYAYGINTKLNLKTTTISGGYSWIGPGYYTLGNPMLINDRQTFEGRVDQAFLKRRVSVSAYYKRYKDNLIDWKQATTISSAYGIIAKVTLKNGLYFLASFTPNYQETNGDMLIIRNKMNIFSFNTGYRYPISSLKAFSSFSYYNQNADYERDILTQVSKTHTFTLNQMLDFTKPFQVNFNASYSIMNSNITNTTNSDRNVISIVLSGTHMYKKKWKNTIGGKYLHSNATVGEIASDQNKFSLFWDTQVNIWKYLDFGLGIDENIFKTGNDAENYNEFIAQCKLIFKW